MHALKEAHRNLVPGGIMIDLRPLSLDIPLEIICHGGRESAGMIDTSPGIDLDKAADQAIDTVLKDRTYKELYKEYFDFAYYWKSIKEMEDDLEEFWKDDVILPEGVIERAHMLFNKQHPGTQIRVALKMKLGKYVRQE